MRLRFMLTAALGLTLALAPRPAAAAMQFEAVINSAQEVPTNAVWTIPAGDVANLKLGLLYVNIHSQTFPGGEIRGQIVASTPTQVKTWGRVKAMYASGTR